MNRPGEPQWPAIDALLDRLYEAAPNRRAAILEEVEAEDPALAAAARRLAAAADAVDLQVGGALATGLVRSIAADTPTASSPIGEQIGPWRLVEELGRGGMGIVYLAERTDGQFEQQVALKLLFAGPQSDDLLRRFELERQILARLEHPHIARLLDGGTTEEGRPWFAMERVEGVRIDHYCDRHRLSVEKRLRLFVTAAEAVQAAHRSLIIHRDLKPANVLVTRDGLVKLLDFGIAKPLDAEAQTADATRTLHRMLTPEYATPEQIRGEPLTTASDVYQLGLLLYELLTGRRAHRLEETTPQAIERAVCEAPPTRPSAAILAPTDSGGGGVDAEALAALRDTSPARLARRLRGDLDTIVLTALRKEPERRYSTAEALAADVRRHLRSLPVEARGEGVGYRVWKFLGRHRVAAAATTLVALALTASTLIAAHGLHQARREAQAAAEISSFLEHIFRLSDPSESRGRSVTVREVLDSAVERLEAESTHEPAIEVRLRRTLGSVYANLGLLKSGEPLLRRAAERGEELLGPSHKETLAARAELGVLLWRKGAYREAEEVLGETVERSRTALGEDAPQTLEAATSLGLTIWRQGRFEEAEEIFSNVLGRRRRLLGDDHTDTLAALNNLALVHLMRGDSARAEALFREAWQRGKRVRGEDHPATLDALNNLAMSIAALGRLREARDRFRELVELRRRVLGAEHPRTLSGMTKLGDVLARLGELDEAESAHRSVLASRERILGPTHPDTLWSKAFLADVHILRGELDAAEPLLIELHTTRQRLLGEEHPDTLQSLRELAELRQAQERLPEAESLYRQALERFRRIAGEEGYWSIVTLGELGLAVLLQGRNDEALELLNEAVTRANRAMPNDPQSRGTLLLWQGRALAASGRLERARSRFQEAAELLQGEERQEALQRLGEVVEIDPQSPS